MTVNKKDFQKKVLAMSSNGSDEKVRNDYFKLLVHFAEIIAKKRRVNDLEDCIQDLVEYSMVKRLHERIDPSKSAWSYYYKSLNNHVSYLYQKKLKNRAMPCDMFENMYDDDGAGENEVLKKLSWSLDDYDGDDIQAIAENMDTVVATKAKRGRPTQKKAGEKAAHWEYLFSQLNNKKTMTESALVKQLPDEKRKNLKDPAKSVKYYMRQIANREKVTLSIKDDGSQTVYMVVGD